jgi:hypothetical protein
MRAHRNTPTVAMRAGALASGVGAAASDHRSTLFSIVSEATNDDARRRGAPIQWIDQV